MSLIENPYRKAIRVTQLLIAASVVLVILGLALAGATLSWVLIAAGMSLLVLCLMALPFLVFTGRGMRRRIQALVDGGFVAHWTYGETEWRTFTEAEWKRAGRKARGLPLQVLGIMLVVGVVLGLFSSLSLLDGLLLGGAIGVPLGILVGAIAWLLAWGTYRKRKSGPGEVYIGPAGVYQDGYFTAFGGVGGKLNGAAVEPGDPAVLKFQFTGSRGPDWQLRVAVPRGKEQEARDLAARFGGAGGSGGAGADAAAARERGDERVRRWLNEVMARLQPDQIKFGPGEKLVDVFQRTLREEEERARAQEGDPALLAAKLKVLEELKRKFA